MFFILSSGRSGSKTIATALNRFGNCLCAHHPQPELILEATEFLYGNVPAEDIETVVRESRHAMVDGKVYGEANLQHSLLFPVLRRVFPDAKYVWLLRDGRDAVASMYYRGWYDMAQSRIPEVWHRARLAGDRTGDFSVGDWRRLSRFEKCCWIWRKYNVLIEEQLGEVPSDLWRKVYLESLKSSVDELATFLGLQKRAAVRVEKTNAARQPLVAWQQWSSEQRRQFETQCDAAMDRWYPCWRDAAGGWQEIERERPEPPPFSERAQRLMWKVRRGLVARLAARFRDERRT